MKIYTFLSLAMACFGLMHLTVAAGTGSRPYQYTHKLYQYKLGSPMDELLLRSGAYTYSARRNGRIAEVSGPNGEGVITELDIMEDDAKDIPEVEIGPCGDNSGQNSRTPVYSRRSASRFRGRNNRQTQNGANCRGTTQTNQQGGNTGNQQNRGQGWRNQGNVGRGRKRRNAIKETLYYWPGKTLPYSFPSSSYSASEQAVFADALAEFDKFTCVELKERTTETRYLDITRGSGCWSYIGYRFWTDEPSKLSLGNNCLNAKKTAIHEFMHALGVRHQHTRPDRDNYITVNYEHIAESALSNFETSDAARVELFNTPYAYDSIMHYGKAYFSIDGSNTISVPSDPSQEDIIGRSPTFSFEDVQILSAMYSCDDGCGPANCPVGSFQGKDCHCYCRSNDPDIPVVVCGTVCVGPDQDCDCLQRPGACSGVDHSTCNSLTNQCICDSGYVEHFGQCKLISSIKCDDLGVDCKCSLNSGSCNSADPNSVCESSTDTCVCKSGYQKEGGACININSVSCNTANKSCFCDLKGSRACSSVPQSSCDTLTKACVCNQNFYNNAGTCTSTPSCTAIGSGCHCEAQGAGACSSLDNTVCDSTSGACVCDPSTHKLEQEVCVFAFRFHLDGSSISPTIASPESNLDFVVTSGMDATDDDISSNDRYLYVEGSSAGDIAQIETEWLDSAGDWCIDVKFRLQNARVWRSYERDDGWSGSTYTYYPGVISTWRKASTYKKNLPSGKKMKLKLKATPHNPGDWHVAVDAIKVQKC